MTGLEKRAINWYITQKARLSKGTSQIYDLKTIVMLVIGSEVYIKYILDIEVTWFLRITAGLCLLFVLWGIGYIWDTRGWFLIENEWSNRRNHFVKQLRKKFGVDEK